MELIIEVRNRKYSAPEVSCDLSFHAEISLLGIVHTPHFLNNDIYKADCICDCL